MYDSPCCRIVPECGAFQHEIQRAPGQCHSGTISVLLSCGIFPSAASADTPSANAKIYLHAGWQIESSCVDHSAGQVISTLAFHSAGWHAATVPSTVVAALVADGTYPDPYFGLNLRSLPGTSYPIGKMFSVLPMPKESPFRCGWWYRKEFRTPEKSPDGRVWLNLDGINNRADIWLNGRKIAGPAEVAGAYRTYQLDVTPFVTAGSARTCWPSKPLRKRKAIWASTGWIGIPRRPTKTWDSGATCTCAPLAR